MPWLRNLLNAPYSVCHSAAAIFNEFGPIVCGMNEDNEGGGVRKTERGYLLAMTLFKSIIAEKWNRWHTV